MSKFLVMSFYKFVDLPDYKMLQGDFKKLCLEKNIKGTILLAKEGVNATITGLRENLDEVIAFMQKDQRFSDLPIKESWADFQPFYRMKVSLKKEIVTMGVSDIDPNKCVGTYVEPNEWNDLISDPDVVLIDTRNDYEVDVGTFKGAIDPNITTFREFPDYIEKNRDALKNKKIATFCTGGIRCEKATSFLVKNGFSDVYHLKGGILKYFEEISKQQSLWEGECFVFDNRVAVDQELCVGHYDQCHACRHAITDEDKHSTHFQQGVSCPHCYESLSEKTRERATERQKQCELARKRNHQHVGMSQPC